MSLAQHVTQSQGFDYQSPTSATDFQFPDFQRPRRRSHGLGNPESPLSPRSVAAPAGEAKPPEWRRLSYNPVETPQDQRGHNRAAYKVSNLKRLGE